jgi:hypothetical protein
MKLYIKISLALAALSFGMAGCLKDKPYDDQQIQSNRPVGTPRIIEMAIAVTNSTNFISFAFDNVNKDTVAALVPINLATADAAGEDINVTVQLKPSLVDDYNNANSTSFEVPATTQIAVVNNVVTIPKGSHTGYMQVKFNPAGIIGHAYALGLTIASVDKQGYTISGNMGSGVVAIATKNKYDGLYHAVGYFAHPTSPRAIDVTDEKVITASANSVVKALGDLGDNTKITITINPDNTVTIGPGPGTSGSTAAVGSFIDVTRPEYNNTYDPATKTFMLSYGYPMPAPTRTITEKVVYTGVR